MRSKNIVIVVAVLVAFLLGMTSLSIAQKTTISMSTWGMAWEDFLYTDVIIPQFQKDNPDIKVDFYRYESYFAKLLTLFAGGEAPDVMRGDVTEVGLQSRKGMLYELNEYVQGPEGVDLDDWSPVPFETLNFVDKVYFLPAGINPYNVLYYNKDLFNEAGVSYPDYNWTFADLASAAKKLTGGGKYGLLWAIPDFVFYTMVFSEGGQIWDESKTKCIIDSPEAIKGIKVLQKWMFDDKFIPMVGAGMLRTTSYAMFQSGRLGMITEGGWACPAFKRDAPELNFARSIFPKASVDVKSRSGAGGTGWVMNSTTKHPDEAWKFLRALISKEGLLSYWRTTWVEIPARMSVIESPEFRDIIGIGEKVPGIKTEEEFAEKNQALIDLVKNGWFTQEMAGPYTSHLSSFLQTALGELIGMKRGDVELALKKFATSVNESIAKEMR